jgi:hypothetical protein
VASALALGTFNLLHQLADGHGNVDELNNDKNFDGHAARQDNMPMIQQQGL